MNELPFSTLLYRYFFFDWLLRDVRGPTDLERGLAIHHNRRAARWLPTYMLRWLWFGLLCYAAAGLLEMFFQLPGLASWFYVASGLSGVVNVALATVWIGLTQLDQKKIQ